MNNALRQLRIKRMGLAGRPLRPRTHTDKV